MDKFILCAMEGVSKTLQTFGPRLREMERFEKHVLSIHIGNAAGGNETALACAEALLTAWGM